MGENVRVELYIQYGVLVEDIVPLKNDIDFHHNLGTLCVAEYNNLCGKFIEWHQCNVSIESHDQEWAIVQDIKNQSDDSCDNRRNSKNPAIQIKLDSLIQLEILKKNRLTVEGEDAKITFYFQNENVESFISFLKGSLRSALRQRTENCYVVTNQKQVQVLEKSFAELNLFTDDHTRSTVLWNFVKRLHESPYETTMDTFCKVTNTLLYRPQYNTEEKVDGLIDRNLGSDDINNSTTKNSSDEYELITKGPPLIPRVIPPRGMPLTEEQWVGFFDGFGRITQPDTVKELIFHGGILPEGDLRKEVWKYLLGYYSWDLTMCELKDLKKQKSEEYFRMKKQWQSMSAGQADRFGAYKIRMSLIEKDVHRTDRNMEFFAGDNNPNLLLLQEILMTYVMYNFDLGYVQGMSDLLSPLLVQLKDEVDTFWCFVGFMDRVSRNFELDPEYMKEQLQHLYCILSLIEPEFANSLDQDSKNMSFCFRWLLVWFKREFSYEDIFLLWEVLWTEHICKNFHLLVCAAILDNEKEIIMNNNYGFTEILKHINELSNTMNVEQILRKAEGIFIQISNSTNVPVAVREIMGLNVPEERTSENELQNQIDKNIDSLIQINAHNMQNSYEEDQELVFDRSLNMQYI